MDRVTDSGPTGRGDPGGMTFEEYAAARWPALLRTAHLLAGDPAAGEDLVQATLVKAYTQWSRVTAAESPDAYVRRMLLNEFLSGRRRRLRRAERRHLVVVDAEPIHSPDLTERLDLWQQLATLAPRQRAVLVLRYYEDLTEAEIARVLGISPGTVKSQAHDALKNLRARLSTTYGPTNDSEVSR